MKETVSVEMRHHDTQHNDTQHNNAKHYAAQHNWLNRDNR
jgi:hypothetical protein